MDRESLSEWAKDKPLSILQLDPADRAVLRIAGEISFLIFLSRIRVFSFMLVILLKAELIFSRKFAIPKKQSASFFILS